MYTPPVTPWELGMPEVSDPTHISVYDRVTTERSSVVFEKRIRRGGMGNARRHVRTCRSYIVMWEGAAEGRLDDWGEVVTR